MLCRDCRRQVTRGAAFCGSCGSPLGHTGPPLELVLSGGIRVPLVEELMIGRGPAATLRLEDPSVSRLHARISAAGSGSGARIEDAGSSHGTYVDGTRLTGPLLLRDGATIRIGDQELAVERRRDLAEAGKTIVVRAGRVARRERGHADRAGRAGDAVRDAAAGALRLCAQAARRVGGLAPLGAARPRAEPLPAAVGQRRPAVPAARRVADRSSTSSGEAERRFGPAGAARLARLLADLGERGLMSGVAASNARTVEAPESFWRRLVTPREKLFPGLGDWFDALYRRGGWVLFTRPALWLIGALCLAGVGVFVALIALRYGTPFVVASKLGIGGLVFLLGRFLVVAVHETAHGLVMASYGRRVDRAGLKLVAIFPYAFVDTSEAWFEPRARRIAISAAGPVSDFSVGAIFAIACLLLPDGTIRDICFQVAFAGYVGAIFNLNPFIERDGYHMLVDWLREPGLRRRAREQFARRLSGGGRSDDSPVLARYSLWGLGWIGAGGLLRGGDVAALPADHEGARAGVDRLHGAGNDVGRVLRPGADRAGQAAGRADAGR